MPAISFTITPFTIGSSVIVKLPMDASAQLPSRGQVMAAVSIGGYSFESPLEPDGRGSHWLKLDETAMHAAGITAGSAVAATVTPTDDWPEPPVPDDVQQALASAPQASATWSSVTPMARWDWLRWIGSTKNPDTRAKRISVMCSKLMAGTRRPCCFNRTMCCDPDVSKNGMLLEPAATN